MRNYRFGLKPLKEKARAEVKLKSLFGLKPTEEKPPTEEGGIAKAPLTLFIEVYFPQDYDLQVGSHYITPPHYGEWQIISAMAYDTHATVTDITILQPGIGYGYDAVIIVHFRDAYVYLCFYFFPSEIKVYIESYFYPDFPERYTHILYTLKNTDGQTFNCEVTIHYAPYTG